MGAKEVVMNKISCRLQDKDALIECENLGDYLQYESDLYAVFLELYEKGTILFRDKPVKMKHYPPDYGVRTGFYHMICENYQHTGNEDDRKPNFRRCERIKWAVEIIEKCSQSCSNIMIWENERHGKKNVLLFCPELDYLVVLGKRNSYFLLTTAYPVGYPNKRNELIKEYNSFINKQRT